MGREKKKKWWGNLRGRSKHVSLTELSKKKERHNQKRPCACDGKGKKKTIGRGMGAIKQTKRK